MFWSLHATKGGVGTSVIAAALSLELAKYESQLGGVVLVDFGGDQGDILGVDTTGCHGVVDWLCSPEPVAVESLAGLLIPVAPGLRLLPRGISAVDNDVDPQRIAQLVRHFGVETNVVCDLGVVVGDPTSARALVGAASDRRTLVIRPCYLALRRGSAIPMTFDSVVEVFEDARALRTLDVEAVIGKVVNARVRVDPAIARAVDSGTLTARLPRVLRRCVRDLLADHHETVETSQLAQRSVDAWSMEAGSVDAG